jgi:hypothetical protein
MKIMEYHFKMGHGRFFPQQSNLTLDPLQRKSNPVPLPYVILILSSQLYPDIFFLPGFYANYFQHSHIHVSYTFYTFFFYSATLATFDKYKYKYELRILLLVTLFLSQVT